MINHLGAVLSGTVTLLRAVIFLYQKKPLLEIMTSSPSKTDNQSKEKTDGLRVPMFLVADTNVVIFYSIWNCITIGYFVRFEGTLIHVGVPIAFSYVMARHLTNIQDGFYGNLKNQLYPSAPALDFEARDPLRRYKDNQDSNSEKPLLAFVLGNSLHTRSDFYSRMGIFYFPMRVTLLGGFLTFRHFYSLFAEELGYYDIPFAMWKFEPAVSGSIWFTMIAICNACLGFYMIGKDLVLFAAEESLSQESKDRTLAVRQEDEFTAVHKPVDPPTLLANSDAPAVVNGETRKPN